MKNYEMNNKVQRPNVSIPPPQRDAPVPPLRYPPRVVKYNNPAKDAGYESLDKVHNVK